MYLKFSEDLTGLEWLFNVTVVLFRVEWLDFSGVKFSTVCSSEDLLGTVKNGDIGQISERVFNSSDKIDTGSKLGGTSGDLDLDLRSFLILSTMLKLF